LPFPLAATSSYITVPPPYTHAYSAGGPTGESHLIDEKTGGLGEKVQEILFIPPDELEKADKTKVALVCSLVLLLSFDRFLIPD
jgi:carboxy-cis,cis-muconate cyclase